MLTRTIRATAATAILAASLLATAGCSQIAAMAQPIVERTPDAASSASAAGTDAAAFESILTQDGSVSLTADVADDLQVTIDVWAESPKRTQEWTTTGDKTFGYAINVADYRVAEKATLDQKRRVYLSQLSVTSTLSPAQTPGPVNFTTDPRTLVPSDAMSTDRGLLLNSFQGGLLVPESTISQLPDGTTGITLDFALTLSAEGSPNSDGSFSEQTIHQTLPIAIFAAQS
ncbi:fructose 1,6-bisphosphatase [Microbacterium oryzae]|uniref:fructose 1,6-bisphosphatase n=1 Tax=Microbacterium oryzae TaxID=743009 RepID=UPI0025AFD18E|nr:fructose 1,6-bisphosphatase [Microbacterium oryzae]MDN3312197.1 fructose 1,6-bisphosphatase [Microbacterium oryzae]